MRPLIVSARLVSPNAVTETGLSLSKKTSCLNPDACLGSWKPVSCKEVSDFLLDLFVHLGMLVFSHTLLCLPGQIVPFAGVELGKVCYSQTVFELSSVTTFPKLNVVTSFNIFY